MSIHVSALALGNEVKYKAGWVKSLPFALG